MKYLVWSTVGMVLFFNLHSTPAQEVTLVAPGGMRCAIARMTPDFERKIGHTVKATIGSGGGTHQQVVRGDAFDVPIVQPPYMDVINSGNVVATTETPLAAIAVVVVVRKGDVKPDISTPEAVKQVLLAAKAIGAGADGSGAGLSFDETQKKLGIYEQMKPKIKRVAGPSLMKLLTDGDVDVVFTFASEVDSPNVDVVGALPKEISTPTPLVGFVSTHAKSPEAAQALLSYLSSSDSAEAYKACGMQPAH